MTSISLDQYQEQAVKAKGNTLVVAGPGAGKTRVLLAKAIHLLEQGIDPEKVLILTFTIKTTQELKERLASIGIKGVKVDTFHALAYDLLKAKGIKPRLATEEELKALARDLSKRKGLSLKDFRKALDKGENHYRSLWEEALKLHGLYDFSLLLKEATGHYLQQEKVYLLIDEFQDLNPELTSFLKTFTKAEFFLVGDPAQAIYGFRGACPQVIKEFVDYLAPQIYFLKKSYRVPEKVLNFAETLRETQGFPLEPLEAVQKGGNRLGLSFNKPFNEAKGVAKLVSELLGGLQMEASQRGLAPPEIAILSRVRTLLNPIKEAFIKFGIPFQVPSENLKEEISAIESLSDIAKSIKSLKELEAYLAEGPSSVKEAWLESQSLEGFLFRLEMLKTFASISIRKDGVPLLTIHEAKGLEFKVVILVGAEDGLLPFTLLEDYDLAEEKRVAYVAVTRAQESFYFTQVKTGRFLYGHKLSGKVSPFFETLPIKEKSSKTKPKARQKKLFG
ncbi:UvrD/REP helicase [Thermodesulfatator indicus DSM 15286]|uniref:DNA 3'-5' helicase n=1 Tax=Thermodesulfatator indicus (strain DSM 15286 / JCM 11887 / CIR29812) TaxID=667014 RepID=F8A884_THEID|nr:ATP-dependent helicase [Thermodesulfatator indicus]AEH44488.1 UvrD/REP helicase [Thermodesulfatator indicus DSM 15286]